MDIGQGRSMATPSRAVLRLGKALRVLIALVSRTKRAIFFCCAVLACSSSSPAQFQSAFVFAADPIGVAVYTRNDVTGVLTPVAGSPFSSKEVVTSMALDFTGRHLFTANRTNSKISMFTVDPITGALLEVPNSPFASLFTSQPVFLSTESSGQFLYVINFDGSNAFVSSVESFHIDSANLGLVPSSSGATDLPGLFKGGATHPNGKVFYAYLNNPSPSNPNAATFLLFDSSTGTFAATTSGPGATADCLALDPQAQSIALGSDLQISTRSLQPDGTLGQFGNVNGSVGGTPAFMAFDTFGRFLYVTLYHALSNSYRVHIFSPAPLQELPNSPLPPSFPLTVGWTVDPTAPLIYADQVYQVDAQTGIPNPILSTSPISPPAIFSRPPGSQPVIGPVALLSAAALSFGSLSVGQTSSAQTLTITSKWRPSPELEHAHDNWTERRGIRENGHVSRANGYSTRAVVFCPADLFTFGNRHPFGSTYDLGQCLPRDGIGSVEWHRLGGCPRGDIDSRDARFWHHNTRHEHDRKHFRKKCRYGNASHHQRRAPGSKRE